jgi:hypothetical protein
MEIAALVSFGALLVAWILAPEQRTARIADATADEPETLPVAA